MEDLVGLAGCDAVPGMGVNADLFLKNGGISTKGTLNALLGEGGRAEFGGFAVVADGSSDAVRERR